MATAHPPEERPKLSTDVKVVRGAAPAAGFAGTHPVRALAAQIAASSPAAVHSALADNSKGSLHESLSSVAIRIRHSIPFDAFAVFTIANDFLQPCFVFGEDSRQLSALRVKMGEGLVGWVAETGKTIVNGNPAVEQGYAAQAALLHSALAVPLRVSDRTIAVLALYHAQAEIFSTEHLSLLEAQSAAIGGIVEKSLKNESGLARGATAGT
jgi:putative methionine-R-sulfoxide reductase with GAF domain